MVLSCHGPWIKQTVSADKNCDSERHSQSLQCSDNQFDECWWEWKGKGGNVVCLKPFLGPSKWFVSLTDNIVIVVVIVSIDYGWLLLGVKGKKWIGPKEKQRHCSMCTALNDITCLNWRGQDRTAAARETWVGNIDRRQQMLKKGRRHQTLFSGICS